MSTSTVQSRPVAGSKTIRVSTEIYEQLSELSQREHATINETVAALIRERAKREFFEQLREGYAQLRADKAAWSEFQTEMEEWDATLSDGLEPE